MLVPEAGPRWGHGGAEGLVRGFGRPFGVRSGYGRKFTVCVDKEKAPD